MANEVGIIGQMYENRVTKKIGVLEERNEKFKTLLMRDEEGGSFNVTFSTFKSSWRKYTGDKVIETSTQKEEAKVETKAKVEKAEKTAKAVSEKPKISREDKIKALHALRDIIEGQFSEAGIDTPVKITYRGGINIKYNRHNVMEGYVRVAENKYTICTNTDIAEIVKPNLPEYVQTIVHDDWQISHKFRFEQSNIDSMMKDVFIPALKKYMEDVDASKKSEKKEEE